MIKAILFDFWGTLVENGVISPIKQIKTILAIDIPFSEYVVRLERAMMLEEFPSLKEAFVSVCKEFEIKPEEEILEEMIGLWNKNWMLAELYPEIKTVLEELRKKYQLVLISNLDCFSVQKVLEKFALKESFDQIFFSYQMHMIKTDKNFLKVVLDTLSLAPEDCVLVGDSLQSDILPARWIEMPAILVDRRNTRDFGPKVKDLNELKELLSEND